MRRLEGSIADFCFFLDISLIHALCRSFFSEKIDFLTRRQMELLTMGDIQTDFLFAKPSALAGAARLVDLSGLFDDYNRSQEAGGADVKALLSDWYIVGQDLKYAIKEVARK